MLFVFLCLGKHLNQFYVQASIPMQESVANAAQNSHGNSLSVPRVSWRPLLNTGKHSVKPPSSSSVFLLSTLWLPSICMSICGTKWKVYTSCREPLASMLESSMFLYLWTRKKLHVICYAQYIFVHQYTCKPMIFQRLQERPFSVEIEGNRAACPW